MVTFIGLKRKPVTSDTHADYHFHSFVAGAMWDGRRFLMEVGVRKVSEDDVLFEILKEVRMDSGAHAGAVTLLIAQTLAKHPVQFVWFPSKANEACDALNAGGLTVCLPIGIGGKGSDGMSETLYTDLLNRSHLFHNPVECPLLESETRRRKLKGKAFPEAELAITCVKNLLLGNEGAPEVRKPNPTTDLPPGGYFDRATGNPKDNVLGWIQSKIDAGKESGAKGWDEELADEVSAEDDLSVGLSGGKETLDFLGGRNTLRLEDNGTFSGRLGSASNMRIQNTAAVRECYLDWLRRTKQTPSPEVASKFFKQFLQRVKDITPNDVAVIFSVN